MNWEVAQKDPDLMMALDDVAKAEFYLNLVKRYQHNKPEYILGARQDLLRKEQVVRDLIAKFDEIPLVVLDGLPL